MYYRNAQAALVVYDITKPTSLTKAKHWVAELQRQASPGIVIALVGNKLDLANEGSPSSNTTTDDEIPADEAEGESGNTGIEDGADASARKVSTKEAKTYADEESLLFFETSAKTGYNVAEVFTAIANTIPESSLKGPRGGNTVAGTTQAALSGTANRVDEARVNLNERMGKKNAGDCAC